MTTEEPSLSMKTKPIDSLRKAKAWLRSYLLEVPWENAPDEGKFLYGIGRFAPMIQMIQKQKNKPSEEYVKNIRGFAVNRIISDYTSDKVTQIEDDCQFCGERVIASNHTGLYHIYNFDGSKHIEKESIQIEQSCKFCNMVIIIANYTGEWDAYNLDGSSHVEHEDEGQNTLDK